MLAIISCRCTAKNVSGATSGRAGAIPVVVPSLSWCLPIYRKCGHGFHPGRGGGHGLGLMMSLAPLLQARIVIQRRDSSGTSIAWMIVLLIGFILWLCYGAAIGNMPLIVTNVVSCTACTATLAVVLHFRGEKAAGGS